MSKIFQTFTPTAVMKKIVAERRDSDPAMVKNAGSETKVAKVFQVF